MSMWYDDLEKLDIMKFARSVEKDCQARRQVEDPQAGVDPRGKS